MISLFCNLWLQTLLEEQLRLAFDEIHRQECSNLALRRELDAASKQAGMAQAEAEKANRAAAHNEAAFSSYQHIHEQQLGRLQRQVQWLTLAL